MQLGEAALGTDNDPSSRLIVLESEGTRFPSTCPVCGSPAQLEGTIISAVTKLGMPRSLRYYYIRSTSELHKEVRHLQIPVCDKHYYSAIEMARLRSLCGVSSGFSFVCFGFLVLFILLSAVDRAVLDVQWYLFVLGVAIVMLVSFAGLRPSALERHVSIVNLDLGAEALVLKIRHRWYAEELLSMNPGNARAIRLRRRATP